MLNYARREAEQGPVQAPRAPRSDKPTITLLGEMFPADPVGIGMLLAPLATLARGAGDCEDYTIAKMAALKAAGVPSEDLRLVILHDSAHGEDHAVLAVRLDGRWLVLDNRMLVMRADNEITNYQPIFVADDTGVRAYRNGAAPPQVWAQARSYEQDVAYLISAQAAAAS